ncbi:MAG: cupin domain-containing protein [Bacilli bacterium]|jgi:quercetin dioxygenase-like cupin family protein|nr:cupin domain-containing protein [Bacilli bacterium]
MDKFTDLFPRGEKNSAYEKYFKGQSYLKLLDEGIIGIANVTFEPKCRNNWHIHLASKGGGQILLCTGGKGYYQEWGQKARILLPGDVVIIKPGVKHWHGAYKDSWFSHLAISIPGENLSTKWEEEVKDEDYNKLP